MSNLKDDLRAAVWSVGFAAGGGSVGIAVDQYLFPWLSKTLGASKFAQGHARTEHIALVAADLALGVVLLGSILKYVIPTEVESPIGESILLFFFFIVQTNLLRHFHAVVGRLFARGGAAGGKAPPVTTGPSQMAPLKPASQPPAQDPAPDAGSIVKTDVQAKPAGPQALGLVLRHGYM